MSFFTTASGVRLRLSDRGAGPDTIVLVHGWKGSHRLWDHAIERLQERHRVVAFDLRGMGESDKPRGAYDFDELSGDLADVITGLGLADVTLVGWSMGCTVSLRHMERGGAGVARLMLLNGPLKLTRTDDFPHTMTQEQLDGYLASLVDGWPGARAGLPRPTRCCKAADPLMLDWIYAIALQTPLDVALRVVREQAKLDMRPAVRGLRVPVRRRASEVRPVLPGQPRRDDRRVGARPARSRSSSTARTARRSRSRRRSSPSSRTSSPAGRPQSDPRFPGARMPSIAVVQIEPSYMDPAAGLARVEEFTADAAGQGAEIVVFPELLCRATRATSATRSPHTDEGEASWDDVQRYHRAYVEHAQVVPGPYTDALGHVARTHGVTLVVGLAERHPSIRRRCGTPAWSSVPTGGIWASTASWSAVMHERLYFNRGGREDIRTFQTPEANLGVCLCFENLQPLFRRALGRLGEEIHCALWTGPAPRPMAAEGVHLEQHREMGVTHALDTGTFVAISSQVTAREPDGGEHGSWWSHSGGSYIIDPLGRTIASVPDWKEGIAVADCDLSLIDDARLVWNAFSDDARDDLFGPGPVGDPVRRCRARCPPPGSPRPERPGRGRPGAARASVGRGRLREGPAMATDGKPAGTFRAAAVQDGSVWLDRVGEHGQGVRADRRGRPRRRGHRRAARELHPRLPVLAVHARR